MARLVLMLRSIIFSLDSLMLRVTSRLQDEHDQTAAISALEQRPRKSTCRILVKHLRNNASPYIRGCAALVLGRLRIHEAVQPLTEAMSDSSPWVRGLAILALGCLQDPNPLPLLCHTLGDDDPWVREQAATVLINYRGEISQLLLGQLREANGMMSVWTLYVLVERGNLEGTSDILLTMLMSGSRAARLSAMRALKRLMPREAAKYIRPMAYHSDKYIRAAAAFSMGELRDKESVDHLCRLLDDPFGWVRRNAAWSLLEMGEALTHIASKVEDEDSGMRRYAVDARRRLQAEGNFT